MALTQQSSKALFDALVDAFNRDSLEVLIDIGLGAQPDRVISDGTLDSQVRETIAWAERHRKTVLLLDSARKQQPGNQDLKNLKLEHDKSHPIVRAVRRYRAEVTPRRMVAAIIALVGFIASGIAIWTFVSGDNQPPLISTADPVSVIAGETVEIDLTAYVSDDGDTDSLSYRIVESATSLGGTVEDLGGGQVRYAAPLADPDADSFRYVVTDEDGASSTGVVSIAVQQGAMPDGLNVAVLGLQASSPAAQPLAPVASRAIEQTVEDAFQSAGLAPGEYNVVGLDDAGSTGAGAPDLGPITDRLNADIILFGTVSSGGSSTVVEVEFFLASPKLAGADELAGQYEVEEIDISTTNPSALATAIALELEPQIEALVQLLEGLKFYQLDEWASAESRLVAAEAAWPITATSSNGLEAVLQVLGNVAGEQGNLDTALDYFTRAYQLGDTARARFGIAETRFLLNAGEVCGRSGAGDVAVIEESLSEFQTIVSIPAPERAYLPARARVEIGKIGLCLHRHGVDRLDTVFEELTAVVREQGGNDALGNLLGEAHQLLGFYHTVRGDKESAAAEYRLAIASTQEEAREGIFHHTLAAILDCDLSDPAGAEFHYSQSERLLDEPIPRRDCAGQADQEGGDG